MSTVVPSRSLYWIRHERRWTRAERRILLVLLSSGPATSERTIEKVARVRHSTLAVALTTLEAHDMLGRTDLGHYRLTTMGRTFCLQVVGLA